MSLYLKSERKETQNETKERTVVKQKIHKRRTSQKRVGTKIADSLRRTSGRRGRLYSVLGVLCVLAVIIVVAVNTPVLSQAATNDGWEDYTKYADSAESLGEWEFNVAYDGTSKLSNLTYLGEENGVPCAGVATENQLKAVLSGLKTSDGTNARSQKVIFKLTKDLSLSEYSQHVHINELSTENWFEKDTFDGQGHVISVSCTNMLSWSCDDGDYYSGMLFGGVRKDATVRNLKVNINSNNYVMADSSTSTDVLYRGIGGVCGIAQDASFVDVEVSGELATTIMIVGNKQKYFAGIGGLVGNIVSNVKITRCEENSEITTEIQRNSSGWQDALGVGVGGIAGLVTGSNNTISSCYGKGRYTYKVPVMNVGGNIVPIDDTIRVEVASIVGVRYGSSTVTVENSAGAGSDKKILGALYEYTEEYPPTFNNCYGNEKDEVRVYKFANTTNGDYELEKTSTLEAQVGDLSQKKEPIKEGDWYYNGNHYLLHHCANHTIEFKEIDIDEPSNSEIEVTGTISNWFTNPDTVNAKAYLYISIDGSSDMMTNADQKDSQFGHENGGSNPDLNLSGLGTYSSTDKDITVRARMKVVFDEGEENELVWWSPVQTVVFESSDLLLPRPMLELSREGQAYESYQSTLAYPLGTTKCQVKSSGGIAQQSFWCYFGRNPNMVLGDTESDSTLTLDIIKKKGYTGELTLTESMLSDASSNRIYLYVLVSGTQDSKTYNKLYEYDLVVFAKDELISATPDSGSKVPNGSAVTFKIGNGKASDYPYDKMNVLISQVQQKYNTLDGVKGVTTYDSRIGNGTAASPYYLTAKPVLTGTPGQVNYVYVEPCVSEGYEQQYGRFVQEYTYTIMNKASGLELSPTTITMAESGNPTDIPIKEKIYMNSRGSSDIIVYAKAIALIQPSVVTDESLLSRLEKAAVTTVGENAYWWETDESVLYVRCNDLWYSVDNSDGEIEVYEDGKLFFDSSYAGQSAYVSTVLFSSGYDPSEPVTYRYQVKEQDAVAAPTALLADGSDVEMDTALYFNCEQNCVMYYTTDGKEPQVTVAADNTISAGTGTYRYNAANGIRVSKDNGFDYGKTTTIKIKAYPVNDTAADTPVYNRDKKSSVISAFTYTVREQNQVETPLAYPETSKDNMTVVVKGDHISLSCATPGADIYCTINGTTPVVRESCRYPGVLKVEGDYGSYFTVKAMAHKEGMRDSEIVTYLYKIAEKETVSGVTATPSTTNQVIAGDKIILSTTESGADIYYTTDGTTPQVVENEDANGNITYNVVTGKKYDPAESVTVPEGNGYFIIHAIAVKAGMTNSPVAQFVYSYAESVGIPYGNPPSGTVTENTEVVLRCAQENAVIYYEVAYDGKQPDSPTTASAIFSEQAPIVITRDTTIKAFAFYNRESSEIVTLTYKLAKKKEVPKSSVDSGTIVPSGTTVKLSSDGGKVYYTMDGSDPSITTNTAVNIGSSIVITGKAGDKIVIKACTKQSGYTTSEMVTFTYQISQYPGGVTTDTKVGSTLSEGTSIHLMTDVTGGTIYYSTGPNSPITAGTEGNSVTLTGKAGTNVTVKAVAIAPDTTMTGSYASFDYKLMEQLAAPHASIKDGTKLTEKSSVVLKANKGKIYFTIDGTEPTKASNEYTDPIVVSKAMTLKAIAIEDGSVNSAVSSFTYGFAEQVQNVKSSIPAGTVEAGAVLKLSCATEDAKIYYSTDGTDPSGSAEEGVFLYDDKEGISIHRSVTLKAIARKDSMCDSELLSVNYKVDEVPIEIARKKAAEKEAEEGLKPSDASKLTDRRAQSRTKTVGQELQVSDFMSDITLRGDKSLFSSKATLRSKEISIPDGAKKEVKKLLGDDYDLVHNFSFALYNGGERIYPAGTMEIGIPIPQEYENADVTIVSINENDGVKVCDTTRENGYIYAQVSYLNNFALAVAQMGENSHDRVDLVQVMSIVAGALVLAGTGMIAVTLRRRKRY